MKPALRLTIVMIPLCGTGMLSCSTRPETIFTDMFTHHFTTRDMPGDSGWGYGTPALADFDSDGDLDFALV